MEFVKGAPLAHGEDQSGLERIFIIIVAVETLPLICSYVPLLSIIACDLSSGSYDTHRQGERRCVAHVQGIGSLS